MQLAHESNPFLVVVLETHHITLQFLRAWRCRVLMDVVGATAFLLWSFFLLFLFLVLGYQYAVARTVAVNRHALAAAFPRGHVNLTDQFLCRLLRHVHRHADAVVHPFLHCTLHAHLVHPVDVVGCGLIIRRLSDDCIEFLVIVFQNLIDIVSIDFQPSNELGVKYVVFLERIARYIGKGHVDILVVGVYLTAAFVADHKDRLYARSGLRTDAHRARRGDGQHGDIAATDACHLLIEVFIQGTQTLDERIILFALGIIHWELAAFFCQID